MQRPWKEVLGLAILLAIACDSRSEPISFDFQDPKGVNAITIRLDSLLEPIVGMATGITGKVAWDPKAPESTHGRIVVDAASITMAHPGMTKTLHSAEWLDVERHPTVEYEFAKAHDVQQTSASSWRFSVTGTFMLKGAKRDLTTTLSVTHLPGKYRERNHRGDGDLLVVRCDFSVDRTQFGIKPDLPPVTVAREIQLGVGIVGGALRAPDAP